jgi:protein-L-isoaspartate O-methyltransferase
VIHCGAAAREVPPALVAALAPGGRLLIPVGAPRSEQRLTIIDRDRDTGQLLPVQRWPAAVGFGVLTPPASHMHPW